MAQQRILRVRLWLAVMIIGLVASGLTAFPLVTEVRWLVGALPSGTPDFLANWLDRVREGLEETSRRYPFIAYGTDWLAFAHLMIAVAFWGPLRDPVRNVWVVRWGMLACAGIVPLAVVCGQVRGIPFGWTCVDLSFGVFGAVPLLMAYRHIRILAAEQVEPARP